MPDEKSLEQFDKKRPFDNNDHVSGIGPDIIVLKKIKLSEDDIEKEEVTPPPGSDCKENLDLNLVGNSFNNQSGKSEVSEEYSEKRDPLRWTQTDSDIVMKKTKLSQGNIESDSEENWDKSSSGSCSNIQSEKAELSEEYPEKRDPLQWTQTDSDIVVKKTKLSQEDIGSDSEENWDKSSSGSCNNIQSGKAEISEEYPEKRDPLRWTQTDSDIVMKKTKLSQEDIESDSEENWDKSSSGSCNNNQSENPEKRDPLHSIESESESVESPTDTYCMSKYSYSTSSEEDIDNVD